MASRSQQSHSTRASPVQPSDTDTRYTDHDTVRTFGRSQGAEVGGRHMMSFQDNDAPAQPYYYNWPGGSGNDSSLFCSIHIPFQFLVRVLCVLYWHEPHIQICDGGIE